MYVSSVYERVVYVSSVYERVVYVRSVYESAAYVNFVYASAVYYVRSVYEPAKGLAAVLLKKRMAVNADSLSRMSHIDIQAHTHTRDQVQTKTQAHVWL